SWSPSRASPTSTPSLSRCRPPWPPSPCRRPSCPASTACCPFPPEMMPMSDTTTTPLLLRTNLKQLKLPTMLAEWQKLAREAADRDEPYDAYLLRLTDLELTARQANAVAARIRAAGFPVAKDFDTFDFTATPSLPKQKILELARGEWVEQ